ncbi:MAG TPA: PAS domain S-box protein, partial [Verrucomicrobiae bacterium]|nr:PAS domain S-box protein [Verrucomicrobiae bacterium]
LLSDASGQPKEIVGVWVEITERKLAEDALRESERRFNEMMQRVELISLMLDREARITYCNDYLLRITGWRREEVLGRNWFELFIPPDNPGLRDVFAGLLADQPGAWHHENEILTCPGERRLIKWNNTVLRSISGEAIGTASLGEDVTDLRKAEEAFKRRAAELERFHRLSVGRELQMIELKKEINELARQAGKPAPYDLSFLESRPESSPRP